MFTGIITHIGEIKKIEFNDNKDCLLAIFIANKITRKLEIGCSVACNGICLTLIKKSEQTLYFQASQETQAVTTLKNWSLNQKINIEFALRLGDEFSGHIVLGHVDGCAKLKAKMPIKDSWQMIFKLEKKSSDLTKYIAKKGSICIDGISLTVNEVEKNSFTVNIIKHTFDNTNLGKIKIGDEVNIEIDIVARYVNKASL